MDTEPMDIEVVKNVIKNQIILSASEIIRIGDGTIKNPSKDQMRIFLDFCKTATTNILNNVAWMEKELSK